MTVNDNSWGGFREEECRAEYRAKVEALHAALGSDYAINEELMRLQSPEMTNEEIRKNRGVGYRKALERIRKHGDITPSVAVARTIDVLYRTHCAGGEE
jgi:hypothetical protein